MDSYGKNMYYIHKHSKMGVCLNECAVRHNTETQHEDWLHQHNKLTA
jgi:hypothetical protein